MAKKAKPGTVINGYRIADLIHNGPSAFAYDARSTTCGTRVFLKQYKSPSCLVSWYQPYIQYQQEFRNRIETSKAKQFCYKFIDFFEADFGGQCYFQAYEFVEKGQDLQSLLDQIRKQTDTTSWEQRLIWAKVMMSAVQSLHEAKIVHSDLKPPNMQLYKDDTIKAKYRLKLIDMDFSVLVDRPAPWHGHQGYIGSPNYLSPEHVAGVVPAPPSDIFTCGLILYELLGQGHPCWKDDAEQYAAAIKAGINDRIKLIGSVSSPVQDEVVARTLLKMLSPRPADRPTARDVRSILNGEGSEGVVRTHVELVGPEGKKVPIRSPMVVGSAIFRELHPDAAQVMNSVQFHLKRSASGQWTIAPDPSAPNETLVNGRAVASAVALKDGDVLAVGREAKKIARVPVTVRLAYSS